MAFTSTTAFSAGLLTHSVCEPRYRASAATVLDDAMASELWLHARDPLVFNHPAWWRAAIDCFGPDRRLTVISIRQGDVVVALWPLWRKRLGAKEGFARVIEPVAARVTDYCVPLVRKGHDPATLLPLLLEQAETELDFQTFLLLPKWPTNLVAAERIGGIAGDLGLLTSTLEHPCPGMTLPSDYDQLQRQWSKSHRGDVRRQIRRLGSAGRLELVSAGSREEIAAMLPRLFKMHTANWRARSGSADLESGPMATFINRLALDLPLDTIEASEVRIDGLAISSHLGFRQGGTLLWYKPAFDIAWATYAPGKVHIALAAQDAIARGFISIDFMQGNEPYKRLWSDFATVTKSFALARPMAYPMWKWNTSVRKFAAEYRF